jgi:hypothetical protein
VHLIKISISVDCFTRVLLEMDSNLVTMTPPGSFCFVSKLVQEVLKKPCAGR